jgi:hypothetical protein
MDIADTSFPSLTERRWALQSVTNFTLLWEGLLQAAGQRRPGRILVTKRCGEAVRNCEKLLSLPPVDHK